MVVRVIKWEFFLPFNFACSWRDQGIIVIFVLCPITPWERYNVIPKTWFGYLSWRALSINLYLRVMHSPTGPDACPHCIISFPPLTFFYLFHCLWVIKGRVGPDAGPLCAVVLDIPYSDGRRERASAGECKIYGSWLPLRFGVQQVVWGCSL